MIGPIQQHFYDPIMIIINQRFSVLLAHISNQIFMISRMSNTWFQLQLVLIVES